MKHILTFIWLLFTLYGNSQQVIRVCEEKQTSFTYLTSCSTPGSYTWTVDGVVQPEMGESITVDWLGKDFGIHTVEVSFTSTNGCDPEPILYTVSTLECDNSVLYAPNAFTPDGDQHNNVWLPKGYNWTEMHYTIYNRWGEILFESYNGTIGWDGTYKGRDCQQDVYIYKIDWVDNLKHKHQEYGHINLLR